MIVSNVFLDLKLVVRMCFHGGIFHFYQKSCDLMSMHLQISLVVGSDLYLLVLFSDAVDFGSCSRYICRIVGASESVR